jgi:hypothetical protein
MDTGGIVELISEDCSSRDGADIGPLEEALENSFQTFDEVRYQVQGLNIRPVGDGTFEVSYVSSIEGVISDQDIKHKENNDVREIVAIESGNEIIKSTSAGRFWRN